MTTELQGDRFARQALEVAAAPARAAAGAMTYALAAAAGFVAGVATPFLVNALIAIYMQRHVP